MNLVRYINKKLTFKQQKSSLKSYSLGCIAGIVIVQFINYNLQTIIFSLIIDLLILSPLIYTVIKNQIKLQRIINNLLKIENSTEIGGKIAEVKMIYDYVFFKKGEVYSVMLLSNFSIDDIKSFEVYNNINAYNYIKDKLYIDNYHCFRPTFSPSTTLPWRIYLKRYYQ